MIYLLVDGVSYFEQFRHFMGRTLLEMVYWFFIFPSRLNPKLMLTLFGIVVEYSVASPLNKPSILQHQLGLRSLIVDLALLV